MNHEPRETDALSQLFERSATPIDPIAHGRLRALAREIPERRRAFALPRWPFAVGLGALVLVLVLVGSRREPAVAPPTAALSAPAPANQAPHPSPAASEVALNDEVDELVGSFDFEETSSPDALDDLALDPGDLADGEVDAWISAANATLGG